MKKILSVIIAVIIAMVCKPVLAQCENSSEFNQSLTVYNKLVENSNSTFSVDYARENLIIGINVQIVAVDLLSNVKTKADYVTFLSQVNIEKYLPKEAVNAEFADVSKSSYLKPEIIENFGLLKNLNTAYRVYQKRFEKNDFTKKARQFVKRQVSKDGILKKSIIKYSNYELLILAHFSNKSLVGSKDELGIVANRLKLSGCPAYIKLGDQIAKSF